MGSKKSGGGGAGPAPFLVKTYEMVDEKGTDEVISWGEEGASFVVWKPAEFARDLLPLHFKHNNFSSFVRQLNTYGFRKVVPDRWEFTNDNFRRGEQGLLSNIRRRKPPAPGSRLPSDDRQSTTVGAAPRRSLIQLQPPSSTSNSAELHSSSSAASSPPQAAAAAEDQLLELASENEQLRKDNHVLSTELSQAKSRFLELLASLPEDVDLSKLDLRLLKRAEEEEEEEDHQGVKLFGVLLRKKKAAAEGAKRRRCEGGGGDGCLALPWMGISTPLQQESSKVCN